MARIDTGSIILILMIILTFLVVILGMLTKCGNELAGFLNETTTETTVEVISDADT
jgi:hypothetical protein